MKVDVVVRNNEESLKAVIRALDNQLTVSENMAPEGDAGEVLISNGPNVPPSYRTINALVEQILRDHGLIT